MDENIKIKPPKKKQRHKSKLDNSVQRVVMASGGVTCCDEWNISPSELAQNSGQQLHLTELQPVQLSQTQTQTPQEHLQSYNYIIAGNPGCTPVNAITPPWVDQLFIKIDQVDRSVNSINYKVENIATDLGSLSSRVNDVEQSVKFLSDTYDTVKITVESAKAAANEAQSEVRKF